MCENFKKVLSSVVLIIEFALLIIVDNLLSYNYDIYYNITGVISLGLLFYILNYFEEKLINHCER